MQRTLQLWDQRDSMSGWLGKTGIEPVREKEAGGRKIFGGEKNYILNYLESHRKVLEDWGE